jgi:glycosyltransferase involved in cell wall biosynthesis
MKDDHDLIRVLHILGGVMDVGGIETFLMNYYRNIDSKLIQFDFCIVEDGQGVFDNEIRDMGGNIFYLPAKKKSPIKHIIRLIKVLRLYRNFPVHLHLEGMNGFYGLLALINKNKIRISHSHSTNHLTSNKSKILLHELFKYLNRIVNNFFCACSNDAAKWLHGKKKTGIVTIIPNAIEFDLFYFNDNSREELRVIFNLQKYLVIGHVGNFHPSKNHNFMLNIADSLMNENISFKMVFIGDGEKYDEIQYKVFSSRLKSSIIFLGKTRFPQLYYNMMDIYIQPSKFEGLGVSLIEAQANGLPAIVSAFVPIESIFNTNVIINNELEVENWVNVIKSIDLDRVKPSLNVYNIKNTSTWLSNYYLNL